ncbi:hypothetical protein HDU67_007002 [Dinochytrium kinnereticum]|nr:hypothetical protein HDU67_007002 [Dinochytrium kinnereticum]
MRILTLTFTLLSLLSISEAQQLSPTVIAFHQNRVCPPARLPSPNLPQDRAAALRAAPQLGAGPGLTPPCTGDRTSEVKEGLKIPCMCPPPQDVFAEQFVLDHGNAIRTDGSVASERLNIEKAIVTLQNSFCCPAGAVRLNAQLTALNGGRAAAPARLPPPPPPAAPAPPAPAPPAPAPPASNGLSATANLFRQNRVCPSPVITTQRKNPASDRAAALRAAPQLGAGPGLTPPCTGDRDSAVRRGLKIPCSCPPPQDVFAEQFVVDHGANILTDGSVNSQKLNIEKAIVTLQESFCCPAGAVTLSDQLSSLNNGGGAAAPPPPPPPPAAPAPPAPAPPAPAPPASNGLSATANLFRQNRVCPRPVITTQRKNPASDRAAALRAAPQLGAGPGLTPPCTGDRDSEIRNGLKIPCSCPPPQDVFAEQFVVDHGANILTDGSRLSQRLNIEKAIVTLQESFCCPAGAVTLSGQLSALV